MSTRFHPASGSAARKATAVLTGVLLAGVWALPSGAQSSGGPTKQPSEVVVANDATRPVPVNSQGTTQVAGTVTANIPGAVATMPAGEIVQFERFVTMAPDGPPVMLIDAFEVPGGKRLLIEHVTAGVAYHPEGRIQVRYGQANGLHFLPLRPDPNTDSDTFVNRASASEAVTAYVDDRGPEALELKIQILREGPRVSVPAPAILTFVGRLITA